MSRLDITQFVATIRFHQGYRYLDRCGEALIKIEGKMDEGWIPSSTSPQQGVIRNFRLGLTARFTSELMQVEQHEFISLEHFVNETCLLYEILWTTFSIERIRAPSVRVTLQAGFDSPQQADEYVRGLGAITPAPWLSQAMGGKPTATTVILCTEDDVQWGLRWQIAWQTP